MAGVGFELRRMIDQRDGFLAKVRAYACAGLISSGPWVMTILTLTLLNMAGPYLSGESDYSLFRALVTYAFAFSLILQGIGQMAITRRVADLLYSEQYERVLPAFVASFLGAGVVHVLFGAAFCVWAGFPTGLSTVFVTLLSVIGMTWISLVWLSVAREYDEVLRAYIYGTLISLVGMVLFTRGEGPEGILGAYTLGQAFILFLLVRTILRGMEKGGRRDFSVYRSLGEFPRLVAVGFLYNAGIWADKMLFWFKDGTGPHPYVQYHPLYDTCSFLAYLTVVPALAVNLIRLETSFYIHYRAYYGAILGGTPLSVIEEKKRKMFENLQESTIRLIRVQGALTVLVILFAGYILDFLEMPEVSVRIFRLTCLGAFFHVLLLITVLMQLYFDLRSQAVATTATFLVLNGGLAWWSVEYGIETYGIGYAVASFLSLLLGYILLHQSLEKINYLTFTSQPIGGDRPEGPDFGPMVEAAAEAAGEPDGGSGEEQAPEVPVPLGPEFEEEVETTSEEIVFGESPAAELDEDNSEDLQDIEVAEQMDMLSQPGSAAALTTLGDATQTLNIGLDGASFEAAADDVAIPEPGFGIVPFDAMESKFTDPSETEPKLEPEPESEVEPESDTEPGPESESLPEPVPEPAPDFDPDETRSADSFEEFEPEADPEVLGIVEEGPPADANEPDRAGTIEVLPGKMIVYPEQSAEPPEEASAPTEADTDTDNDLLSD